jgi:hypothetical protein
MVRFHQFGFYQDLRLVLHHCLYLYNSQLFPIAFFPSLVLQPEVIK